MAIMRVLCLVSCTVLQFQAQVYKEAVFVGLTKGLDGPANPIMFDHEELDVRSNYDIRGGKFYAFNDGFYWAALSGGAQPGTNIFMVLDVNNSPWTATCINKYEHNGTDTRNRDTIFPLKSLQSAHVFSGYGKPTYSDKGLQTSLAIFRLTDLMKYNIFFNAGRSTSFRANADMILPLPNVRVNEGNYFDVSRSIFGVPRDGYYFLSYSAAPWEHKKYDSELRRNAGLLSTLESRSTTTNNLVTISRGGLFYLTKGDLVYILIKNGSSTYDETPKKGFNSLCGFLYDPVHGKKHAWSVARTTSLEDFRKTSPLPFDRILINLGNGFDAFRNSYVCPLTGVYYITYTIGAKAGRPVDVNLMVDGVEKASISRTSTAHSGMDILSRSAILHIQAKSLVYLEVYGNTAIFSDAEMQTTFTGLFLFAHP